tara:strand:+ start:91 stop:1032 length:942 start_codon:yes stop_codon:yes gene_type:complete
MKKFMWKTYFYKSKTEKELHQKYLIDLRKTADKMKSIKIHKEAKTHKAARYIKLTEAEKKERRYQRFLNNERNTDLIEHFNNDLTATLHSTGIKFGMTRERARQILETAKSHGIKVRSYGIRTEHLRNIQTKKVAPEIHYALENLYGTPEYFVWQKDFRKRANPIQKKFLRDVIKKAWDHNLLDPLDSIECCLKPTEKHHKVVNLKNQGYTATQVAKKIGKSKPLVDNLIREARAFGLYPEPKGWRLNQIKAVSLTQDEIDKKLDEIRTQMKLGMNLSQIEKMKKSKKSINHFVSRHHYLAKYEQNKKEELKC